MLFALELSLRVEDIHSVALISLTDGPDDKKCDLVFVDRTLGRAIVAQGYRAADTAKQEAPAEKASALNTAVSWLLSADPASLPERLRPAAEELDSAIADGDITAIEIWYCHNLPESVNVQRELDHVQRTAATLAAAKYPGCLSCGAPRPPAGADLA